MDNEVFLYLLTFLFTVLLTDHLRRHAVRAGWVDMPDARKRHTGAIPPVGGEAIFAGCLLSALAVGVSLPDVLALFAVGGIVLLVGALDDWFCFGAGSRLVAQIAAATAMAVVGDASLAQFQGLVTRGEAIELGWLGIPVTVIAAVMIINAVNLIDGMDGLAGGLALIALGGVALMAGAAGSGDVMVLALILASGTAAFLALNIHSPWRWRASVFLGDSGSTFLGFALAWLIVQTSNTPGTAMSPGVGLWLLMVPLFDAAYVALRRMARGRSPFHGDRQHLHLLFRRAGLPVGYTLAVILTMALVGAMVGMLGATVLGVGDGVLIGGFCVTFLVYGAAMTRAWAVHPRLRRAVRRHMQSTRIAPVVARERALAASERLERRYP
jgi:UDP-GlcNAc:undecaprenyl-phosphate GlcNAc-1-phosphate transferase